MALLVLLQSIGCGPEPSPSAERIAGAAPSTSVFDSAGILVTETLVTAATVRLEWQIDSQPSLTLGSEERESEVFFGIRGLKGLPGGGLLVVDGGSQELRFFDSSGHLTQRIGRSGEGPGEFRLPYLVQSLSGDSLLMWDGILRRFQVFHSTGELINTINLRMRWPSGRNPPLGAVGTRLLARMPEVVTPSTSRQPGVFKKRMDLVWAEPETGIEVPISSFTVATSYNVGRIGGPPASASIPFTARPAATVSDSSAMVTDGVMPEIREYGLDGGLRRIFRVPGFRRPVNPEVVEAYIQYTMARLDRGRKYSEESFRSAPSPDTLPAFRSLLVDEVGWTWAEVYHWDRTQQSGQWMIFNPEGKAIGIIETPPGLQVQNIGSDYLLGVRLDDLGVEQVERYTLRRRPDESGARP